MFQTDGFTPNNFGSFYRGNPDLNPEKSFGWEIGVEQTLWGERLDFGVTYFKSDIDDLMQVVFDPSFNSTYVNIDKADIQGAEAFIHTQVLKSLAVRLDYTYTDAEDESSGEQLLRRPKHKLDLDVEYRPTARMGINLALNYVSDYKDISRETAATINGDDYAVWDITAEYQFNKRWRAFGRVENVADEHYEPADGFQAPDRGMFAGAEFRL